MTLSSKAIGLRSSHARFEPQVFSAGSRYVVQGVLEAEVTAGGEADVEVAKRLMASPWIGTSTGKQAYQVGALPSNSIEGLTAGSTPTTSTRRSPRLARSPAPSGCTSPRWSSTPPTEIRARPTAGSLCRCRG